MPPRLLRRPSYRTGCDRCLIIFVVAVAAAEVADAADADVVEVDAAAVAIPDASSLQDYPVHMGNQRAEAADCGPT